MTISALNTSYDPRTKLADIPWDALPLSLQQTCHRFIDAWWNSLDPDQPIDASGLGEMTVADIRQLHQRERDSQTNRPARNASDAGGRYRLITFMRIDPEDDEPLTYEQALAEKEQQELMSPEHLHRIEEL